MRGYTNTNEKTMQNESVENWTLEQCKDYLQDYPNGLNAETVRNRLKILGCDDGFAEKDEKEEMDRSDDRNTGSYSHPDSVQSDSKDNTGQIIFILVAAAILMVCAFYFEWRTSLKIMIVVGTCVSLGKIGNNKDNN